MEKLQGVQEVTVDWEGGSALISYDAEATTVQWLRETVEAASGADHVYRVVGSGGDTTGRGRDEWARTLRRKGEAGMAQTILTAPKIHCDGCAQTIRDALTPLQGVEGVEVDVNRKKVTVTYDPARLPLSEIRAEMTRAGFPAE
ncbi:MAG: cation transporter [Deltaproteobacteria bacterium]|nr:cation transporter [Deltaproteobacteria bacterium]MBI3079641.1 cation transporter [Deltaproteobacteria bacterium]